MWQMKPFVTSTNWIKTAVDAYPFIPSREGNRAFYISDNNLYYLRDTKPQMILSDVSAENCYVMNDCKKVYCLTASESTAANSLIVYDGKNTDLITNNAVKLVTAEYLSMNYDSTPFSTYTAPPEHDISSQTDAMVNSAFIPDINSSTDTENVPID